MYLAHMLDAIRRFAFYVKDLDRSAFDVDTRTEDAVIRNLEVSGEAARNILTHDPAFASRHPEMPLAVAYRMRNALSHGYADIDLSTVWSTIHDKSASTRTDPIGLSGFPIAKQARPRRRKVESRGLNIVRCGSVMVLSRRRGGNPEMECREPRETLVEGQESIAPRGGRQMESIGEVHARLGPIQSLRDKRGVFDRYAGEFRPGREGRG